MGKCPNINPELTPNKFFLSNNQAKYAYLTFYEGEISTSLILAYSIRKAGTKSNIIILVPNELSEEHKYMLSLYYDYLITDTMFLTKYKKIILIYSVSVVVRYPDSLFLLESPAGCWMIDQQLSCKTEGDILYDGLLVFEPTPDNIKNLTSSKSLAKHLSEKKITLIPTSYIGLDDMGSDVSYNIMYQNILPYSIKKHTINQLIRYPHIVRWHAYYSEFLSHHPEFIHNKLLDNTNQIHKFFHSPIQKKMMRNTNSVDSLYPIAHMLSVKQNKINTRHLSYYHYESTTYKPHHLRPLFPDIIDYDYLEPIRRLSDYFGNHPDNYYNKILSVYSSLDFQSYAIKFQNIDIMNIKKRRLDEYHTFDPTHRDLIMLEYIRCKPQMKCLITNHINMSDAENIISSYGTIFYSKTISITRKGLYNLLFEAYDELIGISRVEWVKHIISNIGSDKLLATKSTKENITFIFFIPNNEVKQSDKYDITNQLKKVADIKSNNHLIHISDHFYQTINYAEMVLSEQTIKFLEQQMSANITNQIMNKQNIKFQTFRKWVMKNLSSLEKNRLMISGDMVLQSYGLRMGTDIDILFVQTDNKLSQSEEELIELLDTNFTDKKTKFFFTNLSVYDNQYENIVYNHVGAKNILSILTDPKYYYWYQNIKFFTLPLEIISKVVRSNVSDNADFLMMNIIKPEMVSQYVVFDGSQLKYNNMLFADSQPSIDIKQLIRFAYKNYTYDDLNLMIKFIG